ncbi:ATP-binding protein [Rhodococcus qingshengii]|uniref:ATP-binding protein n=1 Tax=Rhodococcus qingshengii TaxID=334542 RepID=UPI0035A69CF1
MDIDEAMRLLASASSSERLRGARGLFNLPEASKLSEIRHIRNNEPDSWVRSALDRAVSNWKTAGGNCEIGDGWISTADEVELEDIRAKAIQSVTETILHEVKTIVGDIFTSARRELGDEFPSSATENYINRLRSFLDTIKRLHDASTSPQYTEFDLANLIAEEIYHGNFTEHQVIVTRSDSVTALGDPELLRIALINAIRNAVEASEKDGNQVVINCGVSHDTAWIAVLDNGIGLPEGNDRLWDPGVTKKSKEIHFGWGLPIAQRAVHSFGGSIKLTPREHGGTSCEIRWSTNVDGV